MTKYNFNKKNHGLEYVKTILEKKHRKQQEQENLNKIPNPIKSNKPKWKNLKQK